MVNLNNCFLAGTVLNLFNTTGDGAACVRIELELIDIRKNKEGKTIRDRNIVDLYAWDSAAQILLKDCNIGSNLVAEASVRNNNDKIFFRINKFSIV